MPVISYANALASLTPTPTPLSSVPSAWNYTLTGTSPVADVSYDLFTAAGPHEYEVMIWLAALGGAGPISASYGASGAASSVSTATISIAGSEWKLFRGLNPPRTLFSFVTVEPGGGVSGVYDGVFGLFGGE